MSGGLQQRIVPIEWDLIEQSKGQSRQSFCKRDLRFSLLIETIQLMQRAISERHSRVLVFYAFGAPLLHRAGNLPNTEKSLVSRV